MGFNREINTKEWHKIGDKLTGYFGICSCQRKIKSIIDNLYSIHEKCNDATENGTDLNFSGAEWLIIAIMDKRSNAITHGINCEYPIINKDDEFWQWIVEVKDNPNLEDNQCVGKCFIKDEFVDIKLNVKNEKDESFIEFCDNDSNNKLRLSLEKL